MERRGEADDAAGGNGRDKVFLVDEVVASGLMLGGGTVAQVHEAAAPVREGPARSPRHGRDACRVVIIDERSFRRESVVRLLREVSPDCTFLALARPTDLAETSVGDGSGAHGAADADVVILDIGWARLPDQRIEDDIRFIHEWLGDVPIILLSDREDGAHVAEALRRGVRGFIPTSLCTAVVVEAMRLVTAGGTFIPASALIQAVAGPRDTEAEAGGQARRGGTANLTPREIEVLDLLREGRPNKLIAAQLDLKETTVKIHVRHIMKKMKATNRTEAALMAERAR